MPPARESTGFIRERVSYRIQQEMRSINNANAEYWTQLMYYATVPTEGRKLLQTKSDIVARRAFPAFAAFIKQAHTYYDSAITLHHRAASLNYYYCFLNLAKAAIIRRHPTFYGTDFVHGLQPAGSIGPNLFDRTSKVWLGRTANDRLNAYDRLYRLFYDRSLPEGTELQIGELIRYCSEAGYQNSLATGLTPKQVPGYYSLQVSETAPASEMCWSTIAFHRPDFLGPYPGLMASIEAVFERVDFPKPLSRSQFGIDAAEHNASAFYQTRTTTPDLAGLGTFRWGHDQLKSAIGDHFYPNYYADDYDFYISLPLDGGSEAPMNECLAVYAIIHHLSDLVRYRPDYLERLLSSKEAWVLESIIDTCAPMYLRGIVPLIVGVDFRVVNR